MIVGGCSEEIVRLSPYIQARSIFDAFIFVYVLVGFSKGTISPSIFQRPLRISDEKGRGITVSYNQQSGDVLRVADNLRLYLGGTSFITFDSVLNQVFGSKPQHYAPDDVIHSLRAIVYIIRCAYAHTPQMPTWEVRTPKYLRVFRILEIGFEIDFTGLSGQRLTIQQCGGWAGVFRLMQYCLEVIRTRSNLGQRQEGYNEE